MIARRLLAGAAAALPYPQADIEQKAEVLRGLRLN